MSLQNIPTICLSGQTLGCTYVEADNYNPSATFEDGSCIFSNIGSFASVFMFGTHYQQCTTTLGSKQKAGFILHIAGINDYATNPNPTFGVSSGFDQFTSFGFRMYAYTHRQENGVNVGCSPSNPFYCQWPVGFGNNNKLVNMRKNTIFLGNSSYSSNGFAGRIHSFNVEVLEDETDFDFTNKQLPVEFVIYKTQNAGAQVSYSGNILINVFEYFQTINLQAQLHYI